MSGDLCVAFVSEEVTLSWCQARAFRSSFEKVSAQLAFDQKYQQFENGHVRIIQRACNQQD